MYAMDVTFMDLEPQQPDGAEDAFSMDTELAQPNNEGEDFTSFNAELMELPEGSPKVLDSSSEHAQLVFKQWLSLQENYKRTNAFINSALEAGDPINTLGNTVNADAAAGGQALSYPFPAPLQELKEECISRINQLFNNLLGGLLYNRFKQVTKEICKLPSFMSSVLFRKIDTDNTGIVSRKAFYNYWVGGNMLTTDETTQIYRILKQPKDEYLSQADFQPVLREILATHPGLKFLSRLPEFQQIYAETVIYTIFYHNDRSGNGRITLRDLKRGNLIDAMKQLEEEEDTAKVRRYFSINDVLVIYSKHWELIINGGDVNSLLQREDLMAYNNDALSKKIVDRIFAEVPRKLTCRTPGKMNYQDFVYFLLAEENKAAEASIEYWFKCLDLDENEMITGDEIRYFYEEQMHRIWSIGYEAVPFRDMLCRIIDMIAPQRQEYITLRDFKRSKLSVTVFNILFNLQKYRAAEFRDPDEAEIRRKRRKAEQEHPDWTDWDHFVNIQFSVLLRDAQFMAADRDSNSDSDSDSDSDSNSDSDSGSDSDGTISF